MRLSRGSSVVVVLVLLILLIGVIQVIARGMGSSHTEKGCCPADAAAWMSQPACKVIPSECPASEESIRSDGHEKCPVAGKPK